MNVIGGVPLESPSLIKSKSSHTQASSVYQKRKRLINQDSSVQNTSDIPGPIRKARFNSVFEQQNVKGAETEVGDPLTSPLLEEI